jgi:phosphonatase-like hydrolase
VLKLVVFDIAGTTVRDEAAVRSSLQAAVAEAGLKVSDAEAEAVMGLAKPVAIAQLARERGRDLDEVEVDGLHHVFRSRMVKHYQQDPRVAPMPGAEDCFRRLRSSGVFVALDTGFSRDITDAILTRLDWCVDDLLDATICSDEVPVGRPEPFMIQRLMKLLGVDDPREVCKVGDTPSDLYEGSRAGCGFNVGVLSGTGQRAELAQCPHTHLIASVADLPEVLRLPEMELAGGGG